VASRKRRKKKRGWAYGWPGKVPRNPAAPHRKKEKKKADRKVPDRPVVVKGERL
jgi:hypothetical protein